MNRLSANPHATPTEHAGIRNHYMYYIIVPWSTGRRSGGRCFVALSMTARGMSCSVPRSISLPLIGITGFFRFDILLTSVIRFYAGNGLSSAHFFYYLARHPDHRLSPETAACLVRVRALAALHLM